MSAAAIRQSADGVGAAAVASTRARRDVAGEARARFSRTVRR